MESNFITTILLPAALFFIMTGMGLSLVPDDFKRVAQYPKTVMLGLFLKVLMLPAVAFLLLLLLPTTPELAIGVILIAACPGGATSNLVTHLAKGDVALSITLTAIASVVTVLTIPLFMEFALEHYLEEGQMIELPLLKTVIQILVITVVPVIIGMLINNKAPKFALKADKPVRIISAVFLILIIFAAIAKDIDVITKNINVIGPICLLLNLAGMSMGYFGGKLFKLGKAQSITFSIETGIVNGTLGIAIAAGIIQNPTMSIPSAIYSILMFFTIIIVVWHGNRK